MDPLFPTDSHRNRHEYILVDYDGFCRNIGLGMINSLRVPDMAENLASFPGLGGLIKHNQYELYTVTSVLTPLETTIMLCTNPDGTVKGTPDDYYKITEILRNAPSPYPDILPAFLFGLTELVHEQYVQKIIIGKSSDFEEWEAEKLFNIFKPHENKIELIEGAGCISAYALKNHEVTTIAFSDANELVNLAYALPAERIKRIYLLLALTLNTGAYSTAKDLYVIAPPEMQENLKDKAEDMMFATMWHRYLPFNNIPL